MPTPPPPTPNNNGGNNDDNNSNNDDENDDKNGNNDDENPKIVTLAPEKSNPKPTLATPPPNPHAHDGNNNNGNKKKNELKRKKSKTPPSPRGFSLRRLRRRSLTPPANRGLGKWFPTPTSPRPQTPSLKTPPSSSTKTTPSSSSSSPKVFTWGKRIKCLPASASSSKGKGKAVAADSESTGSKSESSWRGRSARWGVGQMPLSAINSFYINGKALRLTPEEIMLRLLLLFKDENETVGRMLARVQGQSVHLGQNIYQEVLSYVIELVSINSNVYSFNKGMLEHFFSKKKK